MCCEVINGELKAADLPNLLNGVEQCSCCYWKGGEVITRLTSPFGRVAAVENSEYIKLDFQNTKDESILHVEGEYAGGHSRNDGYFTFIELVLRDKTEIKIFFENRRKAS